MRIVFMGTPDFAVESLKALIFAEDIDVVAVVTQPDKMKGRNREAGKLIMTPVKELAVAHDIPVYQPVKVRKDEEFLQTLTEIAPDLIVVVAFGQILPESVLKLPRYGCINVHASLLPQYRGAAPIQWAVLNGDATTGITIQRMEYELDTGDIIVQKEVPLNEDETSGSLFDRLALLSGPVLMEAIHAIADGSATYTPQDPDESIMYATMLTKEMGLVQWEESGEKICRYVRGLDPWPGAFTHYHNKTIKLWKTTLVSESSLKEWILKDPSIDLHNAAVGSVVLSDKNHVCIKTGDGTFISIEELQAEGKKRMSIAEYQRGNKFVVGEILN